MGGSENEYFLGCGIFVDIFGFIVKLDHIVGHFYAF